MKWLDSITKKFGWDALEPKGRRKSVLSTITTVDKSLSGKKRNQLAANSTDLVQNFSVFAWMIRRHLDYVSKFRFQAKTVDKAFNVELEKWMEKISRPDYMDVSGRFGREKFFRHIEARRCIDGDVGILFLRDGRCQSIQQDLISDPAEDDVLDGEQWVAGVRSNGFGRPLEYSLHKRNPTGSGSVFSKRVNARNLYLYGFFDKASTEQKRGVSPVVASLNPLRDLYENFDYSLIKSKVSQLFLMAIMREAEASPMEEMFGDPNSTNPSESGHLEDCPVKEQEPRKIDLSNGPSVLDLDVGEKIDVIESKNPSNELQTFSRLMIMVSLKALDIPYSFFDESHTNYSGSRGSWLQYDRSCMDKRDDQIELRRRWTIFRLTQGILDGEITLPSGFTIEDALFEWVPIGTPWFDNSKEIKGDLSAIASGLDSPIRITKERGRGDIFQNINELAEVMKHAEDVGKQVLGRPIILSFDPVGAPEPNTVVEVDNDDTETDADST
jgi:capsid protein